MNSNWIKNLDVDKIVPMLDMRFSKDAVKDKELEDSVRQWGVRHPILTRPHPVNGQRENGMLEVIDGRRRLRISKILGLKTIPGEIREMDDEEAYTVALISNIQRSDVGDMGVAQWVSLMQVKFNWNQGEIALKVGKSQSWVSRMIKYWKDVVAASDNSSTEPQTERRARAIRGMSEEARQRLLNGSVQLGEQSYSARELERLTHASKTPEEVLKPLNKSLADEYLVSLLMEDAGLTAADARGTVTQWKLGALPWQRSKRIPLGDYKPSQANKDVQLYRDLSKYFPYEVIDAVGEVAPAKTLDTWISNCRRFVAKLFERATPEMRQAVLEEFKL